jgi:hypothetical protein
MRSRHLSPLKLLGGLILFGLLLAGCGDGKSSSPTGPTSTTLTRLEVQVQRDSAALDLSQRWLGRVAELFGWPRVAEAGHCTVTAGTNGVTASTGPDERAVLPGVGIDANGHIPVLIECSDGTGGSLTLPGGTPGAVVTVRVRVGRGRIEVVAHDVDQGPEEETCTGTITALLNRNLTVPAGATCVVDADVHGNATVHGALVLLGDHTFDGNVDLRGGVLNVQNARVRGNVSAGSTVELSGATLDGNLSFRSPGQLELSNGPSLIRGNLDFQAPTLVTGAGQLLVSGNISCRGHVTDAHAGTVTAAGHKDNCGTL